MVNDVHNVKRLLCGILLTASLITLTLGLGMYAHADDSEFKSHLLTPDEIAESNTLSEEPKQAENIDLKEVVDTPLLPSSETTKTSEAQPTETQLREDQPAETSNNTLDGQDNLPAEDKINTPKTTGESISVNDSIGKSVDKSTGIDTTIDVDKSTVAEEQGDKIEKNEEPLPESQTEETKPSLLTKIAKELVGSGSDEEKNITQKPLLLLNSEVLPGTSTRLGWSPSVSFMGISAPTAVLVLNGVKPGPTLCLTAAVHGDELNGIEIVRRVLYDIDPQELSGAVIGVPIVNLQGFRRSSRYLPDRRDLNRFFPGNPEGSSAARIAYSFFSEVVTHCDMMIDLHTASFRRTNLPQLRADLTYPEVASLTENMGAIVVVQSKGATGSLRRAAVESGIPTVTLEAGAPHELQKNAVEHGVKSIENAMDSLGMIKRRAFWQSPAEPVYYQSSWVRSRDGGILFSDVSLGERVKKGDVLGSVTDPITNSRSEIIAPFDGRIIGMALNQVMFPGFAAYHIGLKASIKETEQGKVLVDDNELSSTTLDNGGDEANITPNPATEDISEPEDVLKKDITPETNKKAVVPNLLNTEETDAAIEAGDTTSMPMPAVEDS